MMEKALAMNLFSTIADHAVAVLDPGFPAAVAGAPTPIRWCVKDK